MKAEVKSRLERRQKKLNGLGPERGGSVDQMAYLTNLATRFQRLAAAALSANHGADSMFDEESALRLTPAVILRMKAFSDDMARYGETYSFLPPAGDSWTSSDDSSASSAPPDATVALSEDAEPKPKKAKTFPLDASFDTRKQDDLEELQEVLYPQISCKAPKRGEIKGWLLQVFQGNRGFELGTFNSSILATVMKKQSSKWMDISLGFVSDIIVMVHRFITTALASICSDDEIHRSLANSLFDDLIQRYQKALESTKFILEVENGDTPMTLNHYFNDNLQKW